MVHTAMDMMYIQTATTRTFNRGKHIDGETKAEKWCRRQESNLLPTDYETVALTT